MKKIFLYIAIFLLCGFIAGFLNEKYHNMKIMQMKGITVNDTCSIDTLKDLVLKGNKQACIGLKEAYLDIRYYQQEFLLYSLIMANKFNFPDAYYFVYSDWTGIYNINFRHEKMNEKTKSITMDYLKRGAELNDYGSIEEMQEIHSK
jgi:hypothetical protein